MGTVPACDGHYNDIEEQDTFILQVMDPVNRLNTWFFFTFATGLFSAGLTLICILKNDHPTFYKEYRNILMAAIILLTAPLLLRSLLDGLSHITMFKNYVRSDITHVATYNL